MVQRMFAGLSPVPRRPFEVPAVLEVYGELAGNLARPLGVSALETVGRSQVQPHPLSDGDAPIEHLLIQGVNEGISPAPRPIRPLRAPDPSKKLASSRQRLAPQLALLRIDTSRDGD